MLAARRARRPGRRPPAPHDRAAGRRDAGADDPGAGRRARAGARLRDPGRRPSRSARRRRAADALDRARRDPTRFRRLIVRALDPDTPPIVVAPRPVLAAVQTGARHGHEVAPVDPTPGNRAHPPPNRPRWRDAARPVTLVRVGPDPARGASLGRAEARPPAAPDRLPRRVRGDGGGRAAARPRRPGRVPVLRRLLDGRRPRPLRGPARRGTGRVLSPARRRRALAGRRVLRRAGPPAARDRRRGRRRRGAALPGGRPPPPARGEHAALQRPRPGVLVEPGVRHRVRDSPAADQRARPRRISGPARRRR